MITTITSPTGSGQWMLDPGTVFGALLSMPWVSLILAAIVAVGISASPRWRAPSESRGHLAPASSGAISARYAPEHRSLGIVAIAVIAVFLTENLITRYTLGLDGVVSWWRYAMPVFVAFVGVAILLALVTTRGSMPAERPTVSPRRTWLSFSSRVSLAGAAVALLALTTTTLLAGLASSNIDGGPYVFLEIDVPNEAIDPIRLWFYGWAYGLPVLVCTGALIAVTIAALQRNAARPYLRPETVLAEQRERRDIATGIARITTSGALLALAGAWRFIADAGSLSGLTIEGDASTDSYVAFWRYGEVASVGGWLAPVLEITAFTLLFFVTAQLCAPGSDPEPAVTTDDAAEWEKAQ